MLSHLTQRAESRLLAAFLALLLGFSACFAPYCVSFSAGPVVQRSEANANPVSSALAFGAIVTGLTGFALVSSGSLTYDGFKSWASSNGYSDSVEAVDDSIFNIQNFGSVAVSIAAKALVGISAWLVHEGVITSSSNASVVVSSSSVSIWGIDIPFGGLRTSLWDDPTSWAFSFRYPTSYEYIYVPSDASVSITRVYDSVCKVRFSSFVSFTYDFNGNYLSSDSGGGFEMSCNFASTSTRYSLNPSYSGDYYFYNLGGTVPVASCVAGVWSGSASVVAGGSDLAEVDGYPYSRDSADAESWADDVISGGGNISVPADDVINPGWSDTVSGNTGTVVSPEGVNGMTKDAFLDYVLHLVRTGAISLSDAIDLVNAYVKANSLSMVDSISMTLSQVAAFLGCLVTGFEGWDWNHLTSRLGNLPWHNVWPFCYIYDLYSLLESIDGALLWDFHITADFSDQVSSATGTEIDASFDFDFSEWLPAFAASVRFFFIASFFVGLLWFSIAAWLKVPHQD